VKFRVELIAPDEARLYMVGNNPTSLGLELIRKQAVEPLARFQQSVPIPNQNPPDGHVEFNLSPKSEPV
jgi:hypothetical protein